MYENYYRLKAQPFRLTPDHKFCYSHRSYAKAKAYMQYAFERAEGFVMITGKAGTGKTTLVNDLIDSLPKSKVTVATLVSTQLEADDLLRMSASSFGVEASITNKSAILQELSKLLIANHKKGQRALLIVDEAQDLRVSSLEELRLLTNLQLNNHQLIQIFLLGQEKLAELIQKPEMEQVHQRLVAAHRLETLSEEETKAYIKHRLTKAGWRGDPAISNAVYSIIAQYSGGIPRRINSTCTRLLLHGSVEQRHQLGVLDAQTVIEELTQEGLSGEIGKVDINFNETDIYDLDDTLVEGSGTKSTTSTFSLAPNDDEDAEPNGPDTSEALKSVPTSVKDTWINNAPEPEIQQLPPDHCLSDAPPTSPQHKPITNLDNQAARKKADIKQASPSYTDLTKKLSQRRFFVYAALGIVSLAAGSVILFLLISKPGLNTPLSNTNQPHPAEPDQLIPLSQKSETNVRPTEKPVKTPSMPTPDIEGSVTEPQTTHSSRTEHFTPTANLITLTANNSKVTSVDGATEESIINTIAADSSIPDTIITFEFDKFYISPKFQRELDAISKKMNNEENNKALIVGHSDNVGDPTYNLTLSRQRAIAVAAYLARSGIPYDRLVINTQLHPRGSNTSETATAEQRVVKVFLSPGAN